MTRAKMVQTPAKRSAVVDLSRVLGGLQLDSSSLNLPSDADVGLGTYEDVWKLAAEAEEKPLPTEFSVQGLFSDLWTKVARTRED